MIYKPQQVLQYFIDFQAVLLYDGSESF